METEMVEKVNLDRIAAQIVHEIARKENRTRSNAASTMIRRAWASQTATERAATVPDATRSDAS
jgi:hypothetical protein